MRSFKIIISILFAVSFANICNAGAAVKPVNVKNLIAVVEGGTGKVWIMKGTKILDKFNFGDIHGGLKYSPS
jgi:hypothetical protein